jgi:chaperone modulatory protein CbpM
MTMAIRTYLVNAQFGPDAVEGWIQAGWLLPREDEGGQLSDIDLARAQLIHDLTANLGINDEGVPVILDLIDQLHGLRRVLRAVQARRAATRTF